MTSSSQSEDPTNWSAQSFLLARHYSNPCACGRWHRRPQSGEDDGPDAGSPPAGRQAGLPASLHCTSSFFSSTFHCSSAVTTFGGFSNIYIIIFILSCFLSFDSFLYLNIFAWLFYILDLINLISERRGGGS